MKTLSITLQDLFKMPTAEIYNASAYKASRKVVIDSRAVTKGAIFVALKGEKYDGHDFITQAEKNGATSFVINKSYLQNFYKSDKTFVTVSDTTIALGWLAYTWRKKSPAKVVAITGSNGKTSTKDYLTTILSEKYSVHSTSANNNNHIGVPLTILSSTNKHDVLVLELGTNHFGEINYTANIALPNYALITNIGNSHLEFLINKSGVLKEKKALFDSTETNNGKIFINAEDPFLSKLTSSYSKTISFGAASSDYSFNLLNTSNDGRSELGFSAKTKTFKAKTNLLGEHNYKNINAAVAVASELGLSKSQIKNGIAKLKSPKQRLNLIDKKYFSLIDDTYNANPESMKSALQTLSSFKNKKRIALLGDMFELGKDWKKYHQNLSAEFTKKKIDEAILIGDKMKYLHSALIKKHFPSHHFLERDQLNLFLASLELCNCVLLIKGSRGMKMEEFVKILMERN